MWMSEYVELVRCAESEYIDVMRIELGSTTNS